MVQFSMTVSDLDLAKYEAPRGLSVTAELLLSPVTTLTLDSF